MSETHAAETASQGEKRAWVADVLHVVLPWPEGAGSGVDGPGSAASRAMRGIAAAAARPEVWTRPLGDALSAPPGAPPQAPIAPAVPVGPATRFVARNGRKLAVVVGQNGKVALTCDRPPVREITFSGGGGKGNALPGAVAALQATGVLKDVQTFRGASVGSMTAAFLAGGMSAETLTEITPDIGPAILGESHVPIHMKGKVLEDLVRSNMGKSVRGRIASYLGEKAGSVDEKTLATLQAIDGKLSRGGGVTFGDLRTLSKIVPGVKELAIDGTMMGDDSAQAGRIDKGKPQLAMFNADTEPDLDVALAVHASAALPPVFEPVDLKLSSGVTGRFQDGGLMNNAPTGALVGADRALDPIPESGSMAFLFEDKDAHDILKGKATPEPSPVLDFLTGAPLGAALYGENRGLADKPEDVVMVPLKFDGPWYKRTDFTGFVGGVLNFAMAKDARIKLQGMSREATAAHVAQRQEPETREFGSVKEMLSSLGRQDVETMAAERYPGAKEELAFRDGVATALAGLEKLAAGAKRQALEAGPLRQALQQLDELAGGDMGRLAYVGRELNRSGRLDPLLDAAKASGKHDHGVLDAGVVVADALAAKSHAQTVLREMIYPKMMTENPKGVGGTVLRQVDTMLRGVKTPRDFNDALSIAIKHFASKSDVTGLHRHHAFAAELKRYIMKVS